MIHRRLCAVTLAAAASLVSCGKSLHPSGVSAVLSSDVASRLPRDLLSFVEELPAGIAGFGYVDLTGGLESMLQVGPEYQPMVDDLLEMAQRRWGLEVRKLRGVGVVAIKDDLVVFFNAGDKAALPSTGEVAVARLGAYTVVGPSAAVAALQAMPRQPRVAKQHPQWVRSALAHAAGQPAFFTVNADNTPPAKDPEGARIVAAMAHATAVFSSTGGAAYLTAKPGQLATLRKPIDDGLAQGRAQLSAAQALPGQDSVSVVGRLAARTWGAAFFSSLKVNAAGDELALELPWHSPTLPPMSAAPDLAQRVVVADEWAVVQVDLGRPLLSTLIAASDVLGVAIDRKLISRELLDLGARLGFPVLDPTTATLSVGGMAGVVSLHGQGPATARGVFPVAGGELFASATPWGLALTPGNMRDTLEGALRRAEPGMPLAQSSRLAKVDARLRAFVDLGRLPTMLKIMAREVPVETVELALDSTGFEAEVLVEAGKTDYVQGAVSMLRGALADLASADYAKRKTLAPLDEVRAITSHHQGALMVKMLTPKVSGDRLTFSYHLSPQAAQSWAGVAVGVIAAVSVPAFRDYMQRSNSIAK